MEQYDSKTDRKINKLLSEVNLNLVIASNGQDTETSNFRANTPIIEVRELLASMYQVPLGDIHLSYRGQLLHDYIRLGGLPQVETSLSIVIFEDSLDLPHVRQFLSKKLDKAPITWPPLERAPVKRPSEHGLPVKPVTLAISFSNNYVCRVYCEYSGSFIYRPETRYGVKTYLIRGFRESKDLLKPKNTKWLPLELALDYGLPVVDNYEELIVMDEIEINPSSKWKYFPEPPPVFAPRDLVEKSPDFVTQMLVSVGEYVCAIYIGRNDNGKYYFPVTTNGIKTQRLVYHGESRLKWLPLELALEYGLPVVDNYEEIVMNHWRKFDGVHFTEDNE